ncbi:dehydrogenase [Lentinula lateritia]|uniref:Dehydrogenase n=1 Tax=Lentinula lateritia TaxID=40482 RepID=A0ABQ8V973_9AGAR|nr:dehydrogenase [Lentinula lateritia]
MQAILKVGEGKVALKTVEVPKPGPGQVLVKIFAAAQNPSDWMKLKRGWGEGEGLIVGHDFAGVIQQLGPNVSESTRSSRQIGQRVAGFVNGCMTPENGGSFTEYCVADEMMLIDLPDDMSFESASTIGFAAFTACQALWQNQTLPTPFDATKNPFPILVWSGASAVGQYAVQLAKQSGLQVITTASSRNHELLKKLGADAVFDYRDNEVVSKITTFCGDNGLNVAIDCASNDESISLIAQCIGDRKESYIALVLPVEVKAKHIRSDFTYVYTLLGKPTKDKYNYPAIPEHYVLGKWCAGLLSHLVKQGTLSTVPIRVVPNGLADAQYWINYQEEGKVRAEKIVYRVHSS